MKLSLHSPNGQFGCVWLSFGRYDVTLGFVPATFGCDLCVDGKIVFVWP